MILDLDVNRRVVNGMRSLGIILVIGFHGVTGLVTRLRADIIDRYIESYPHLLNPVWQALGSEIVFLFSGFLVSYFLLREFHKSDRVDIGSFYVNRLSRILPLFWVALILYAFADDFTPVDLLLNLLFVSELAGVTTIIPVGWSLELLVQLYLVLPFAILLLVRSGHPVKLSVALLAFALVGRFIALTLDPESYQVRFYEVLYGADTPATQSKMYYLLGYRSSVFILGFQLAYLVTWENALLKRMFERVWFVSIVFALSAILVLGSGFLPLHDQHSILYQLTSDEFWLWFWTLQRFLFAIGIAGLTLCAWYAPSGVFWPIVWLLKRDVWTMVSRNIYSIFLFHPIFLVIAAVVIFRTTIVEEIAAVRPAEIALIVLIATVLSVTFGQAILRFVELPAQRRIRRWWKGRVASA